MTSAVVCMHLLCVLAGAHNDVLICVAQDSLVDQPQAEGTLPVQVKIFIYLKKAAGSIISLVPRPHPYFQGVWPGNEARSITYH